MLNLGSQPVCRAVQLCVEFSALDEEDMVLKLVSITIYLNIFVAQRFLLNIRFFIITCVLCSCHVHLLFLSCSNV